MKKIVIIVGSNRKTEESNSYKIAQIVKNKLEECGRDYICNIIRLGDYLKKILELLGTIYIDGFELTVDEPPMFMKGKDLEIF